MEDYQKNIWFAKPSFVCHPAEGRDPDTTDAVESHPHASALMSFRAGDVWIPAFAGMTEKATANRRSIIVHVHQQSLPIQ